MTEKQPIAPPTDGSPGLICEHYNEVSEENKFVLVHLDPSHRHFCPAITRVCAPCADKIFGKSQMAYINFLQHHVQVVHCKDGDHDFLPFALFKLRLEAWEFQKMMEEQAGDLLALSQWTGEEQASGS